MQFFIPSIPNAERVAEAVLADMTDVITIDRAIWLQLAFYLPRSKNTPLSVRLHVKDPKLSMLTEAVVQGLLMSKLIKHEKQIVTMHAYKGFASTRKPMGVEIGISELID